MSLTRPPKPTSRDLAGIAAVITAVGGLMGLYWQHQSHKEESSLVQDSVITLMQYRLSEVEKDLREIREILLLSRAEAPTRGGAGSPASLVAPEPELETAEGPVEEFAEVTDAVARLEVDADAQKPAAAYLDDLVEKVRSRETVRLDEVRQMVKTSGRSLNLDDLKK